MKDRDKRKAVTRVTKCLDEYDEGMKNLGWMKERPRERRETYQGLDDDVHATYPPHYVDL